MIRIRQRDSTNPMLFRESNRPLHAGQRIQIPDSPMPIPSLQPAKTSSLRWLRIHIDSAIPNRLRKPRKPVQPMGINAIARRLGKEPRAHRRPLLRHSKPQHRLAQRCVKIIVGNSNHASSVERR